MPALARALRGADRVARAVVNWARHGDRGGAELRRATVNGQPGALVFDSSGGLIAAMSLDVSEDGIAGVNSVVNPDKLARLGAVGDVRALLGSAQGGGRP